MFFDEYIRTTPKGLAIKLKLLKRKKEKTTEEQIAIDSKINDIEKRLSNYQDIDLVPESTIGMIKIAIGKYLSKSIQYHNISEFLEKENQLVSLHSNKTGYTAEDYKKLVIEYYKNYD